MKSINQKINVPICFLKANNKNRNKKKYICGCIYFFLLSNISLSRFDISFIFSKMIRTNVYAKVKMKFHFTQVNSVSLYHQSNSFSSYFTLCDDNEAASLRHTICRHTAVPRDTNTLHGDANVISLEIFKRARGWRTRIGFGGGAGNGG